MYSRLIIGLLGVLLLIVVFVCITAGAICLEQRNVLYTGIAAITTAVIAFATIVVAIMAYHTWKNERFLELTKEYDELAEKRKDFWHNLDLAYRIFPIKDRPLKYVRAVELIRPEEQGKETLEVWPSGFDPKKIKDDKKNDLISMVKGIEKGIGKTGTDENLKKLWKFAIFIYPNRDDYKCPLVKPADLRRVAFEAKQFDTARGMLARFWDKWASNRYSRKFLLKNYKSAYEQLIMLTWLELVLARQVGEHGKGKVELFKLSKRIYHKYSKGKRS